MGGGGESTTELETTSALGPWQKRVLNRLAPFVIGRIGEGVPSWGPTERPEEGEYWWTAGPTPEDEQARQLVQQFAEREPSFAYQDIIQEGIEGLSPERMESWYRENILPSQRRLFEEETLPGVREAFVGKGLQYSRPAMQAEARAYEKFGEDVRSNLAQAIVGGRQTAAQLLPTAAAYEQAVQREPLVRAEALAGVGGLYRELRQRELSARAQAYKEARPELSPMIDRALQILGLTTQAGYLRTTQTGPGLGHQLLSTGLQAAGTAAGAFFGGPPGAMAGNALASLLTNTGQEATPWGGTPLPQY